MDQSLLEILCCPLDKQSLRMATIEELERVNERIRKGELRNRAGRLLAEPLGEALITQDNQRLYPVVDGIPVMLIDESIVMGD